MRMLFLSRAFACDWSATLRIRDSMAHPGKSARATRQQNFVRVYACRDCMRAGGLCTISCSETSPLVCVCGCLRVARCRGTPPLPRTPEHDH
jgi:hypothetical protein